MVIHFLKEDCLTALKANIAGNLKHYSEPTNDWVYEFLMVRIRFRSISSRSMIFSLIRK